MKIISNEKKKTYQWHKWWQQESVSFVVVCGAVRTTTGKRSCFELLALFLCSLYYKATLQSMLRKLSIIICFHSNYSK